MLLKVEQDQLVLPVQPVAPVLQVEPARQVQTVQPGLLVPQVEPVLLVPMAPPALLVLRGRLARAVQMVPPGRQGRKVRQGLREIPAPPVPAARSARPSPRRGTAS